MRRIVVLSLAVGAFAVGVRLPVLHKIRPDAFGAECESVAKSLMRGDGWSDAYGPGTGPTAHVSPVYPILLQSLYRVFGPYDTPSGRLAQQYCSLGVATLVILLLPAVARRLGFPPLVGWSAAFLVAWLPAHRWHHVTGFEQSLATLILFGLIWACTALRDDGWRTPRTQLTMGALLGLTGLAYPTLLLGPILWCAIEFLRRRGERWQVSFELIVIAATATAVLAPWAFRNERVLGGFVPFRSNFGLELAIGNRPGANGRTYAPGFYDLHPLGNAEERERLIRVGEVAYMKEQQRKAMTWIADHPTDFAELTLRRVILFWFSPNEKWYSISPRLMLGSRIYGLLGVCLILELGRLLWTRHPSGTLLSCFAIGLGVPYFLTHVELRYTAPFVHLSALATCSFVWEMGRKMRFGNFQFHEAMKTVVDVTRPSAQTPARQGPSPSSRALPRQP